MIKDYIKEERFMLTYGDGLGNVDIEKLLEYHSGQKKIVTFTGVHPVSRFASVEMDKNGEIIGWSEKKQLEEYISAGFFVMEKKIFDYLDDDCELEEAPMEKLAKARQVAMYKHEGFWQCMDTYRDYKYLNELWGSGNPQWKIW